MSGTPIADGSAEADAPERHTIDFDSAASRWRWACPHGHSTIEPCNGGAWCRSCASHPSIDDPHHHELLDKRHDRLVDWARIEVRGR